MVLDIDELYEPVGLFSNREYPFGTLLFLLTLPLNLIYLFYSFIIDFINYDVSIFELISIEFFILNFVLTLCGLFLVYVNSEWNDGCF